MSGETCKACAGLRRQVELANKERDFANATLEGAVTNPVGFGDFINRRIVEERDAAFSKLEEARKLIEYVCGLSQHHYGTSLWNELFPQWQVKAAAFIDAQARRVLDGGEGE